MSICGLRCRCPLYGDAIMEQQCSFFILRVFRFGGLIAFAMFLLVFALFGDFYTDQ